MQFIEGLRTQVNAYRDSYKEQKPPPPIDLGHKFHYWIEQFRDKFPQPIRRQIVAEALSKPYPIEIHDPNHTLAAIDLYMKNDWGIAGFMNHFSEGDPPRAIQAFIKAIPEMRDRIFVTPVARHQIDDEQLLLLSRVADLVVMPVFTKNTKEHEERLIAEGKPIPWIPRRKGFGLPQYADFAADVLKGLIDKSTGKRKKKGMVVYAPQGSREDKLYPFTFGAIAGLDKKIHEREIADKTAYVFMGLEIVGENDYSQDKVSGSNKGRMYRLTFGPVIPVKEFHRLAEENYDIESKEGKLEQQARRIMFTVVPKQYIPEEDLAKIAA